MQLVIESSSRSTPILSKPHVGAVPRLGERVKIDKPSDQIIGRVDSVEHTFLFVSDGIRDADCSHIVTVKISETF